MRRLLASWVCLILAAAALFVGAVSFVAAHNLFDSRVFGDRAAQSLRDPKVAAYVSERIADEAIQSRPDLIAYRPLIQVTANAVVSSRAFQSVFAPAARRAHEAAFSRQTRRAVLALPDLQILVRDALKQASPEVAAKIPPQVGKALNKMGDSRNGQYLLQLSRTGTSLRWLWLALLPASLVLFVLSLLLAPDKLRGLLRTGIALLVAGAFVAALLPAGELAARLIPNQLERGFARGLWWAYLGDLVHWALLFVGLGVIVMAGATSHLDAWEPMELARRGGRFLTQPPPGPQRRLLRGVTLSVAGVLTAVFPQPAVLGAAAVAGVCAAFLGTRELFRVFVERFRSVGPNQASETAPASSSHRVRGAVFALMALCLLVGGAAWYFFVHSSSSAVAIDASSPEFCNGYAQLCDKHLDEVAFAGTHNSMSNEDMPGWLFPQQEASIPKQLSDGIRALLIDVHYGFPGGARVKTDLSTEKNTAAIKAAVGEEGFAAAMRLRTSLVGVDTGQRRLYLCHGFCELGAYELEPELRQIRAFLVGNPDEVIVLDIEDYVKPQDLAAVFEASRLSDFVYKGPTGPPWPTLRQAIASGQRVYAFIESGLPGVDWLRPAYPTMRETPYSFHKADEFSCNANRGGNTGSLFLLNHWIETTPTPKPSNAAIVNAYPFLLKRAEECAAERHHMVNIVAVDFYRTGDLLRVVNRLNGVGGDETESALPAVKTAMAKGDSGAPPNR